MQLTRIEQEKIQPYVIKNMIENQQTIRNQLDDPDTELQFIEYMIERKYKQAFDLCCTVQGVWLNEPFMQVVIDCLTDINKRMSQYTLFDQDDDSKNKTHLFVVLDTYIDEQAAKLPDIIFD